MRQEHFDECMLCCHLASACCLTLYFGGAVSACSAIIFESALLSLFKTLAELAAAKLTPDLIAHHACMLGAALAAVRYPDHAFLVVHVQTIHLPLALNYARRVSRRKRGGGVDSAMGLLWFAVVSSRNALFSSARAPPSPPRSPSATCSPPSPRPSRFSTWS